MAYDKDPDEPGAAWARFIDDRRTFEYRPFDIFANATEDSLGRPLAPSKWKDKERLSATGKKFQVPGRVLLRTRASDGRYSRTTALE